MQHLKHSVSAVSSEEHIHTTSTTSGTSFFSFYIPSLKSFFFSNRWKPFDPARNWPDLGLRFKHGEEAAKLTLVKEGKLTLAEAETDGRDVLSDKRDLDWSAVLKRTFEAYIRGERPNMYGEWMQW